MGDYTEDFDKFFKETGMKFNNFVEIIHDAINFCLKYPIITFQMFIEYYKELSKKLKKYKEKYGEIE